MAEPWIRVHAQVYAKPVTIRLAEALCRGDRHRAVGLLVTFWCNVSLHALDGHVADRSDAEIEGWAEWKGKRKAFAQWVRSVHLDAQGRVNEWDEYAGALELRRATERQRLAEKRKLLRNNLHGVAQHAATVDGNPRAGRARADDDETLRNETSSPTASVHARTREGLAAHPAIARLLARLPEHRRTGYLDRFLNWLDGVGLPAGVRVTLPSLLDAIDEYDGGDTPDLLLRFVCRKAKTLRDHAATTPGATARRSMADDTYDAALAGALAVQRLAKGTGTA